MIEPDVFWSDILLGLIAFAAAYALRRHAARPWWITFTLLGLATWFGAFYHGFINTTTNLSGNIAWTITLLLFFAASASIVVCLKPSKLVASISMAGLLLYAYWAWFISEKFIWALAIQGLAVIVYLLACVWDVSKNRDRSSFKALLWLILFILIDGAAIVVQQTKQQFGLTISHNTIFHIIEMPALIALAVSMYHYGRHQK